MTREHAEKVANVLIGVAAASAVYFILKDPSLRRSAWQAARRVIAASGPWLVAEARHAWADSGGHGAVRRAAVTDPDVSNARDMMGA